MRSGQASLNRYGTLIERVFLAHYKRGASQVQFSRDELVSAAADLGMDPLKNIGDLIYTFRFRAAMPDAIARTATAGKGWRIRLAGKSAYQFVLAPVIDMTPNQGLLQTKIPDATPGVIAMYALSDEQALLAKLRYNRLIDVFTSVTCYSLQSHLRTTVPEMGQVETDEIYVGIAARGAHCVLPVQAKGAHEQLGVAQVEQDLALCAHRFPHLCCRPIGAQFMSGDAIALFEFAETDGIVVKAREEHFRLVPPSELSPDELDHYRHLAGLG